jgi:hypothetical protein
MFDITSHRPPSYLQGFAREQKRYQNTALKHIFKKTKHKQIKFLFRYIIKQGNKEV